MSSDENQKNGGDDQTKTVGPPKSTAREYFESFVVTLIMMTGFARESFKKKRLEELMEEEFDEVFRFEPNKIHWRGNNTLDLTQIEQLRLSGIISFGSCSFDEPVADLQGLGIL